MSRGLGRQQEWILGYLRERFRQDPPGLEREFVRLPSPQDVGESSWTAPEARAARQGIWFVTLREIVEARFGSGPSAAQIETIRRSVHSLVSENLVAAELSAGQLVVTWFDSDLDPDAGYRIVRFEEERALIRRRAARLEVYNR